MTEEAKPGGSIKGRLEFETTRGKPVLGFLAGKLEFNLPARGLGPQVKKNDVLYRPLAYPAVCGIMNRAWD